MCVFTKLTMRLKLFLRWFWFVFVSFVCKFVSGSVDGFTFFLVCGIILNVEVAVTSEARDQQ